MGSVFGKIFRVSTFGESHGAGVGCVIDGCPSLLDLSADDIQRELDRRRPGGNLLGTQRNEADACEIISGVYEGKTLGTPICILVRNKDQRSQDYSEIAKLWRPSHADFTYDMKYGLRDPRGGGRSSARETIGRVAAGAVAKKFLGGGVKITAWVESVHAIAMPMQRQTPTAEEIEASPVRCPNPQASARMEEFIKKARAECDSVGGVIRCRIEGLPAGLGDPVFDRFEADLAKAMLSIPASKGFEVGGGFASARMFGSQNNDVFALDENGAVTTLTNNAGGVLGGISDGSDILLRVSVKPTPSISREQSTITKDGGSRQISVKGRHDPVIVPRAVVVVESMAAITLVDMLMCSITSNMTNLERFFRK